MLPSSRLSSGYRAWIHIEQEAGYVRKPVWNLRTRVKPHASAVYRRSSECSLLCIPQIIRNPACTDRELDAKAHSATNGTHWK